MSLCVIIELMKNKTSQNQHKISVENKQPALMLNSEVSLQEDASIRVTCAQLGELDYIKLYEAFLPRERHQSPTRE